MWLFARSLTEFLKVYDPVGPFSLIRSCLCQQSGHEAFAVFGSAGNFGSGGLACFGVGV